MLYQIIFTKSAIDDIKKMDSVVKKRIKKKIEGFSLNPLVFSKKLTHFSIGSYRWRVGNYRIVFDLEESKIIILRIGHRREIYK